MGEYPGRGLVHHRLHRGIQLWAVLLELGVLVNHQDLWLLASGTQNARGLL